MFASEGDGAICFSATASFTASAALVVVGAVGMRRARALGEGAAAYPYAAIPLIFAAQQFVEGWLWGALPGQWDAAHGLTLTYLLVANILWPVYVPVAVLLMESGAAQRRRLLLPLAAGVITSAFFLYALLTRGASAEIVGHHINYHLPHDNDVLAVMIYATATCLAPLMSSHRMVRLFGAALVVSMAASYFFFAMWFASVWCFFAALLSVVVAMHFFRRTQRGPGDVPPRTA